MNTYLLLPFGLLILSIIYINSYTKHTSTETFQPWMNFNQPNFNDVGKQVTYNDCMLQGYGDDFCTQSTVPNYLPGLPEGRCSCAGGRLGTYQHNGKCFCYIHDDTTSGMYTEKLFTTYTAEGSEWLKNIEAYGRKDTF